MNNIVIDLEMCKVSRCPQTEEYRCKSEIIQIGAVMLDEEFKEISSFSVYVKPEYGYIDNFIENLTGIDNRSVSNAPGIEEALHMFTAWLGNQECRFFAWSNSDYKQLYNEITKKNLDTTGLEKLIDDRNWIDYQEVFDMRYMMERSTSLHLALDLCSIDIDGREHDGLCDARNTGKLISVLEKDGAFQLPEVYERARREEVKEVLSFSLEGLFAGIQLAG